MVGEARSWDGGEGKRDRRSESDSSAEDEEEEEGYSEIVVGRTVEKETFFFWRGGRGRWIIEVGREDEESGSEDEDVEDGESRILDAADSCEVCENMESTDERILLEMLVLELWAA